MFFCSVLGVGLPYFVPGAQRLINVVRFVGQAINFVRANVEWSDTGQISVF